MTTIESTEKLVLFYDLDEVLTIQGEATGTTTNKSTIILKKE